MLTFVPCRVQFLDTICKNQRAKSKEVQKHDSTPLDAIRVGFSICGPLFVGGKNQAGFVQLALTQCLVINID